MGANNELTEETTETAQSIQGIAPVISNSQKIGLLVGIGVLLFHCLRLFGFVHDDAFITYRYSYNLLHGMGPVFNPEEHTEGFSSPLYMILTAIQMLVSGDVLIKAKLLGIVFAGLSLWYIWQLALYLKLPSWIVQSAPVLLAFNSSISMSAMDGMETSFQMMLITAAAYHFARFLDGNTWKSSAILLAAVALNRSEGILYCFAAVGVARAKPGLLELKKWVIWLFAPVVVYFLFRFAYYHEVMPNTYYAKNVGWDIALEKGPLYLLRTVFVNLNERMGLLAISGFLWLLAIGGALAERNRKHPAILLVTLFVLCQSFFAFRTSGDWMQGWRYMNAIAPLWTLLVLLGIRELAEAMAPNNVKGSAKVGLVFSTAIAAVCIAFSGEFSDPLEGSVSWASRGWATSARGILVGYRMENTVLAADFVNKVVPKGSVVAFSEMGALPFYTPEVRWLDTYGLTDSEIAHLPGMNKYRTGVTGDFKDASTEIGKHILSRKPDFVMQWLKANPGNMDILNGNYEVFQTCPLKSFDSQEPVTLMLWKRKK